jgi:hypothetical protein
MQYTLYNFNHSATTLGYRNIVCEENLQGFEKPRKVLACHTNNSSTLAEFFQYCRCMVPQKKM